MRGRWWHVLIGLAALAAPGMAGATPDDDAALAWLAATGRRMAAPEPAAADLAPLVARLAGARVVGIGEATHGTHEDQAFKAALIRALVTAGAIDTLALEANRDAGRRFDRYVRGGEGDPVVLVRSPSFFRIWKGDEFAGLLLWLRAWNVAHPARPVGIIGIDNQDAGVDAAAALAFLARHDAARARALAPRFGTLLPHAGAAPEKAFAWIQASKPGELPRAMAAAAALRDALAAKRAVWGADPDYADAVHAATVAWQNLHQFEREVGVVDLATLPVDYMSRRDRYMATNLVSLLGTGRRAAFWAHDMHVLDELPAGLVKAGYATTGTELEKALGADYRTVGFTYSRATVLTSAISGSAIDMKRMPGDRPLALVNDRPQDLGSVLARLPGDAWWFPLDPASPSPAIARFLARPMWRGWAGAAVDPERFQPESDTDEPAAAGAGFDVLVWFRAMTPEHRWPGADGSR